MQIPKSKRSDIEKRKMNGEFCATRNTLRRQVLLFEALFPPIDIDRDAFRNVYRLRLQMCTDAEVALSYRKVFLY